MQPLVTNAVLNLYVVDFYRCYLYSFHKDNKVSLLW